MVSTRNHLLSRMPGLIGWPRYQADHKHSCQHGTPRGIDSAIGKRTTPIVREYDSLSGLTGGVSVARIPVCMPTEAEQQLVEDTSCIPVANKHVDAEWRIVLDAGSIPAASTN